MAGCSAEVSNSYPGWTPVPDCRLVQCCSRLWESMYGEPLKLSAIHAGLESGILGRKNPELELISMAPGAPCCHTASEYLIIRDMKLIYDFMKAVVRELS